MYTITEIKILGITRLTVNIVTDDLETIRGEWAKTYCVRRGQVKFVYREQA